MTRHVLLGGTGFIGTNLALGLLGRTDDEIVIVGGETRNLSVFDGDQQVHFVEAVISAGSDLSGLFEEGDFVYHLISSTIPATSNVEISNELADISLSAKIFDECVHSGVERVVYFSTGGAIYGSHPIVPTPEDSPLEPISSYGYQKLAIEELLALYARIYELDFRIVRLANPYGPFQFAGNLGLISALIRCAISGDEFMMRGDGLAVRDYIYIDDAINAVLNVSLNDTHLRIYNIGSSQGLTTNDAVEAVSTALNCVIKKVQIDSFRSDVDTIWLDISRYESEFGKLAKTSMASGVEKTYSWMLNQEGLL